jgi:DNA-binding PadR family transcriptional regulator
MSDAEQKILGALEKKELSSVEIQKVTGLWSAVLYPALIALEDKGNIYSYWATEGYPRRRFYGVVEK